MKSAETEPVYQNHAHNENGHGPVKIQMYFYVKTFRKTCLRHGCSCIMLFN